MTFRDATLEDLPKIVEIYNSTVASRLVTADLNLFLLKVNSIGSVIPVKIAVNAAGAINAITFFFLSGRAAWIIAKLRPAVPKTFDIPDSEKPPNG